MFKSCACLGQNEIKNENALHSSLSVMFEYLITEQKIEIFYLGGIGKFDEICQIELSKLQLKFKHIKLILVKPAITNFEKQIDFKFDEVVSFNEKTEFDKMPIFARDYLMAKNAEFLVFYVSENSRNRAKKLLDLAKKSNKQFVNMF